MPAPTRRAWKVGSLDGAFFEFVMLLSKVLRHYAPPQTKEATMIKKAKVTKTKATVSTKSKRASLNPQPTLDAKTAALKERGIKLTWAGRKWHAGDKEYTSLEMSKYSVEGFAKLFAKA
jgi:hypothetical protein